MLFNIVHINNNRSYNCQKPDTGDENDGMEYLFIYILSTRWGLEAKMAALTIFQNWCRISAVKDIRLHVSRLLRL